MSDEEKREKLEKAIKDNKLALVKMNASKDQQLAALVEVANIDPSVGEKTLNKIRFLNSKNDILGQFALLGLMTVWESKSNRHNTLGQELLEDN